MPLGELLDMIACYRIMNGDKQKIAADDEEMIPDLL